MNSNNSEKKFQSGKIGRRENYGSKGSGFSQGPFVPVTKCLQDKSPNKAGQNSGQARLQARPEKAQS
jgi:hypothetical protein